MRVVMAAERADATRDRAHPRPAPANAKGNDTGETTEPEGGTADPGARPPTVPVRGGLV
jgi:hypothetical protein